MNADAYSPERRTALLLSGVGTAGAYHAGVLRALHEAGVKLDVVAGRGIGTVGALFSAVDGAPRLWDEKGFWQSPPVATLYQWRGVLRLIVWSLALSVALVIVPLTTVALGLVVFPIDFILNLFGRSSGLAGAYLQLADRAFAPSALPTWLPRLVMIVLGLTAIIAFLSASIARGSRHQRGASWWRIVRPPLSTDAAADHCWTMLWDLLRGAASVKAPPPRELVRRYTELLGENIGQPGFRELLIVVHDVDARRDLLFALVGERRRQGLVRRATSEEAEARRADVVDLSGVGRDHLVDALLGSLSLPFVTDLHDVQFAADSYWRGETHRLCDRPESLWRLMEELAALEVAQVILVSAAQGAGGAHALTPSRIDGRGRLGEYLQSSEAAAVRDITQAAAQGAPRVFVVAPIHNPIGPFEFGGGFDDRSDRREPLGELMSRGYEDAYRQFIEPFVGASGDRVGTRTV